MAASKFHRITLVSVTGLPDAQGAAYALEISLKNMPGAHAVLCSPNIPAHLHPGIHHRRIAPMNYNEYSWFVMFVLWRYIETDFALLVQDDGWVLDGGNWRDEYFDYDYVGAVSGFARVDTSEDVKWMQFFEWHEYLNRPDCIVRPLLNGGFSLRSQRMLRAFVDHPDIRVVIPPPDVFEGESPRMLWYSGAADEDSQLTLVLRPQFEALGIRYAPVEVCRQFSMEDPRPMYREIDYMNLFGFHNQFRRLVGVDPPTVRYRVSQSDIDEVAREREMVDMLHRRGYRVLCNAPANEGT
ncbi:hypothetical protein AWB82_06617 [Caballeronia glebae]|uniref:DUF5672 domain-containing protein n=1 Tax=Caballeronia glebae TaxID=1777143 RepID=A0A158DDP3_9BURK|nr:DUF5672 family protein [Caballeronia glebae]SAK92520.1 hypothetical protein AWB82_06617 [Caballeronia glebae]